MSADGTPNDAGRVATFAEAGDPIAHDGSGTASNETIVHEWGTYTSVQASDGHSLGGVHHEDEALPAWVHRRNLNDPQNYYFEQLPEEPRQQLETPVLYFYSPTVRDVEVTVSFPQGIVGEWYPDTTSYSPAVGAMTSMGPGNAVWNLTLDPGIAPASFNPVSPDEIWAPSRHVASTPVHVQSPSAGDQREQFLFYRGLGKFVAPVTVSSNDDGTLRVRNSSPDDVGSVFLLLCTKDGGSFVSLGKLGAGSEILASVPTAVLSVDAFVQAAHGGLHSALLGTGLYDDEAQAMVDTWTRSWFRNLGLRVLYVAPRAWTDAWLPTKVTPEPGAMIRTLVGRIEVMTLPDEAELVRTIQTVSQAGAPIPLAPLGRFAESRLERAVELLTDPQAKTLADETRKLVHGQR
jgi:hypothetical protein